MAHELLGEHHAVRSAVNDADADIVELAVQDVGPVPGRVHPGGVSRGYGLVPGDVVTGGLVCNTVCGHHRKRGAVWMRIHSEWQQAATEGNTSYATPMVKSDEAVRRGRFEEIADLTAEYKWLSRAVLHERLRQRVAFQSRWSTGAAAENRLQLHHLRGVTSNGEAASGRPA